jgi:hypothetical protein
MVSSWVGSTIPRVRLGQRMRTTLHAAVVSYRQADLIVTSKMACAGRIVTVTIRPPRKHPGRKIRSLIVHIDEVVSQGRSMTWGELLQCPMVWVGVSQCPTGGWRNRQGTKICHYTTYVSMCTCTVQLILDGVLYMYVYILSQGWVRVRSF